jgi:hypothetical protein
MEMSVLNTTLNCYVVLCADMCADMCADNSLTRGEVQKKLSQLPVFYIRDPSGTCHNISYNHSIVVFHMQYAPCI